MVNGMRYKKHWREMKIIISEINFNDKEEKVIRELIQEFDSRLYLLSSLEVKFQKPQSILVKDFMKEAIGALARERGELRFFTNEWLEKEIEEAMFRLEYYANNADVI